jgi:hypothetical protein
MCLQDAIRSAREDIEWEQSDISNGSAFGDAKTVSTNTTTAAQLQQSLGVLNTISVAAASAAAVLNRSTLVTSRSNASKIPPIVSSSQNVSYMLKDNDNEDESDSFIACDDEATTTTSNNTFEYVMNHTNDTTGSCTNHTTLNHMFLIHKTNVLSSMKYEQIQRGQP